MKSLSKIILTLALIMGINPLSAYYYHSGYYNRDGREAYNNVSGNVETDNSCDTCGYQDYWYQGSLNPLGLMQIFLAIGTPPQTTTNTAPTPVEGTDSYTSAKVREAIAAATKSKSGSGTTNQPINISVVDGRVTLTGSVKTKAEKASAEAAARRTVGVTSVNSKITVNGK